MVGHVYVIHFLTPLVHARHYVGFAEAGNLVARIERHVAGNGARIMEVVKERGIAWAVVKVWSGVTRKFERRIKNEAHTARHCPMCREERCKS